MISTDPSALMYRAILAAGLQPAPARTRGHNRLMKRMEVLVKCRSGRRIARGSETVERFLLRDLTTRPLISLRTFLSPFPLPPSPLRHLTTLSYFPDRPSPASLSYWNLKPRSVHQPMLTPSIPFPSLLSAHKPRSLTATRHPRCHPRQTCHNSQTEKGSDEPKSICTPVKRTPADHADGRC